MPSQAKARFNGQLQRAELLISHAGRQRGSAALPSKQVFLHAALTSQVAAWDAFVKGLSREYFSTTSIPTDAKYSIVHSLLQGRFDSAVQKLNTPNSDNMREFFVSYTGFDPWPQWINIKFGNTLLASSLLVRNRIDEIFKVRHSFAHGFTMPLYSWNTDSSGAAHLDCRTLRNTGRFLDQVCIKTDAGLSLHISSQFGIPRPW